MKQPFITFLARILTTLCCLGMLAWPVQAAMADWQRLMSQAEALRAQGDHVEALRVYHQALAESRKLDPPAESMHATMLAMAKLCEKDLTLEAEQCDLAEPFYEWVAIRQDPGPLEGQLANYIGRISADSGDLDKALAFYQFSVKSTEMGYGRTSRQVQDALNGIAYVKQQQGLDQEARAYAAEAKSIEDKLKQCDPYPDFSGFLQGMQRKVQGNWQPPKGKALHAVVRYRIDRSGHLTEVRLKEASGNRVFDEAALAAVKKSAPFADVPNFCMDDIATEYIFDYQMQKK